MILIRGHPRVLFPLNYKLSMGVSSVQVLKKKIEAGTIRISNRGQHNTRCPLKTFLVYFVYVFFFFFVKNVKFVYVKHSHLWSLNIFCNPLLQNIFQVKCLTVYE